MAFSKLIENNSKEIRLVDSCTIKLKTCHLDSKLNLILRIVCKVRIWKKIMKRFDFSRLEDKSFLMKNLTFNLNKTNGFLFFIYRTKINFKMN